MYLIQPDFKFIDTAIGGFKRRNNVIDLADFQLPDYPFECYRTTFRFDQAYPAYLLNNKNSVKGYRGRCYADFIFIDIDAPDLSVSHKITRDFLRYLEQQYDVPLDALCIYFSGCKGFHVEIPVTLLGGIEPSENLPRRFKNFVLSLGDWNFDERIYDHNRLWRITNSINSKTGLYKIRLTPTELFDLSIAAIKEKAKEPVPLDTFTPSDDWDPLPGFVELWHRPKPPQKTWVTASRNAEIKDLAFLHKGVSEGQRNDSLFIHAKRLRALGDKQSKAERLLLDWNQKNAPPLGQNEVLGTVNSVYSYRGKPLDPFDILDSLQGSLLYRDLSAAQRDVLITIISRARKSPEVYVDKHGNKYHLEPGDLEFSFSGFPEDCAKDVQEASVRSVIKRLKESGMVELITLGGRRLSILRLVGFNTQVVATGITLGPKV